MSLNCSTDKINEVQSTKIIVSKINECDSIFHYTSVEGLKNILQTKKLWFSGIQYLNDANEIKEGINAVKNFYDNQDDSADYPEVAFISELFCGLMEGKMVNFNIFVCSFSLGNDELPLWNYYTKDTRTQGYNICFRLENLLETIINRNAQLLDGCVVSYGNVIYYDKNNNIEIGKILEGLYNSFAEDFSNMAENVLLKFRDAFRLSDEEKDIYQKEVEKSISDAKTIEKYLANIYFYNDEKHSFEKSIFADPTLYIKNKAFESEKEIRIVIQIPDDKMKDIQDKIKFRTCNGILVPYLELEFGVESIDGFHLSPTLKDDIVERGLRKYLDCCGFDINKMEYGIQKSQIPLRY